MKNGLRMGETLRGVKHEIRGQLADHACEFEQRV